MAVQAILGTDKLRTGFRVKYNETINEIINGNGSVNTDGVVSFPTHGGTPRTVNLSSRFYTIPQINDLISGFYTGATTETAGIVERATEAEALALTDVARYITPATLGAVLQDYMDQNGFVVSEGESFDDLNDLTTTGLYRVSSLSTISNGPIIAGEDGLLWVYTNDRTSNSPMSIQRYWDFDTNKYYERYYLADTFEYTDWVEDVPSWGDITDKPTTVDGFGITDAHKQGGNAYAAPFTVGSTDAQPVQVLVNNATVGQFTTGGDLQIGTPVNFTGTAAKIRATGNILAEGGQLLATSGTTNAVAITPSGVTTNSPVGGFTLRNNSVGEEILFRTSLASAGDTTGVRIEANGSLRTTKQIVSDLATGTAPLAVLSTTLNTNLNADLLDGQHGAYYLDAGNLNAGIVPVARLSGTYAISISGNAATATKWATARTISATGDATGSVSIDGSVNASLALTLANSGVTAGAYGSASLIPVITVDAKGRITAVTTAAPTFSGTWDSITGKPTTISGFGITDAVSTAATYNNPAWLTGLAWSKITGGPVVNGTTHYLAKFSGANSVINSQVFDNGLLVAIGHTAASEKLDVSGNLMLRGTELPTINLLKTSVVGWKIGRVLGSETDSTLRIGFNSTNFLTLQTGLRMGINQASPLHTVDVGGTLNVTEAVNLATTSGAVNMRITSGDMDINMQGNSRIYNNVQSTTEYGTNQNLTTQYLGRSVSFGQRGRIVFDNSGEYFRFEIGNAKAAHTDARPAIVTTGYGPTAPYNTYGKLLIIARGEASNNGTVEILTGADRKRTALFDQNGNIIAFNYLQSSVTSATAVTTGLRIAGLDASGNIRASYLDTEFARKAENAAITGIWTFNTAIPTTTQTPSEPSQFATVGYVNSLSFIKPGQSVHTVAFTNITLSGLQTISGHTLTAGQRVLVVGQTTASQNGVYTAASGAWSRASFSDTDAEIRGAYHLIVAGDYINARYINTNTSTITVGTTAITYALDFGAEADPTVPAWVKGILESDIARWDTAVLTTGSYNNPTWLTALAFSKITGVPNLSTIESMSIAGSNGLLRRNAVNTWTFDQTEYAIAADLSSEFQAKNANLTALAAVTGIGILVRTTSTTITTRSLVAGPGIIVSLGDGYAANPIIELQATGIAQGVYDRLHIDQYGRAIAGSVLSYTTIEPLLPEYMKRDSRHPQISGIPLTLTPTVGTAYTGSVNLANYITSHHAENVLSMVHIFRMIAHQGLTITNSGLLVSISGTVTQATNEPIVVVVKDQNGNQTIVPIPFSTSGNTTPVLTPASITAELWDYNYTPAQKIGNITSGITLPWSSKFNIKFIVDGSHNKVQQTLVGPSGTDAWGPENAAGGTTVESSSHWVFGPTGDSNGRVAGSYTFTPKALVNTTEVANPVFTFNIQNTTTPPPTGGGENSDGLLKVTSGTKLYTIRGAQDVGITVNSVGIVHTGQYTISQSGKTFKAFYVLDGVPLDSTSITALQGAGLALDPSHPYSLEIRWVDQAQASTQAQLDSIADDLYHIDANNAGSAQIVIQVTQL